MRGVYNRELAYHPYHRLWAVHGQDGNLENNSCFVSSRHPKTEWRAIPSKKLVLKDFQYWWWNYVWTFLLVNVQPEAYLPQNHSMCFCGGCTVFLYALTYFIIAVLCGNWVRGFLQITSHLNLSKTHLWFSTVSAIFTCSLTRGFPWHQSAGQLCSSWN